MHFTRHFIALGVLAFGYLLADGDRSPDYFSLASPLAEPSTIAGGHVNVITGDFVDYETDLSVAAPEEFQVQRCYNSRGMSDGLMGWGWYSNHDCHTESTDTGYGQEKPTYINRVTVQAPMGFVIDFGEIIETPGEKFKAPKEFFSVGVSNTSQGVISAQTNPREIYYKFPGKITFGDGREISTGINGWDLKPSGNAFLSNKLQSGRRITFRDRADGSREWLEYHGHPIDSKQFDQLPHLTASTMDGRKAEYDFMTVKIPYGDKIHLLYSVQRHDKPFVRYDWDSTPMSDGRRGPNEPKISTITRPNNRRMSISYYNVGNNTILGENKPLKTSSWRVGRVLRLCEPIGKGDTLHTKYQFKYTRGDNGGYTSVYDALMHRTDYFYTKEQRLSQIVKYTAPKQPYSKEGLYWGDQGSDEEIFLKSRTFGEEGNPSLHFCKLFHYDKRGNVLKEELFGNFTGTNSTPLKVDQKGNPVNRQVECLTREYKYSKDGLNLVLEETCNGIKKQYNYVSGTNLLASCFHKNHHQTYLRHFYTHDASGQVIEHIEDDGITDDKYNLSGVTERKIQRIKRINHYPFGLPEEVKECYQDLKTYKEVQIKRTVNAHDSQGHLVRQTVYDANDQFLASEQWHYDGHGNLLYYINPLGETTNYTYDDNDNCLSETGPDPLFIKLYQYDYMNRRISTEHRYDGESFSEKTAYDLVGNSVEKVDIYGNSTKYVYDPFNRPTECIAPAVEDINGNLYNPVTKTRYNALGFPIEITDALGNTTKSFHTLLGSPYRIIHPDGAEDRFEYDYEGRLIKSYARNGSVTCYTLDHQGRPTKRQVFDSSGQLLLQTETGYNTYHTLWEKNPNGVVTTFAYDGAGRKIRETKEELIREFSYNAQGLLDKTTLRSAIDPDDGQVEVQVYDVMQRPIEERVETLHGQVLTRSFYTYDALGNKTTISQDTAAGMSTTYIKYGAFGIPQERHDPDGTVTKISYHQDEQVSIETIDPQGNSTTQLQDALERIIEITKKDPYGKEIQKSKLAFDAMSHCLQTTHYVYTPNADTREVVNQWRYNSNGQVVEQIEAAGTLEERRTTTLYNHTAQKEAVIKPDGTRIAFEYDALGRLTHSSANDFDTEYSYDANSNIVEVRDLKNGRKTCRTYDSLGRMTEETQENGHSLQRSYRVDGSLAALKFKDGSQVRYHYNGPQLSSIERVRVDGATAYTHQYLSYDLSGRLLTSSLINNLGELETTYTIKGDIATIKSSYHEESLERDDLGNITKQTLNGESTQFTYDNLSQLSSEEGAVSNTYSHDSLHNRVAKNGNTYSLNALNQLLSDGESAYTYDLSGNLTQAGELVYKYDTQDRLLEVIDGSKKTRFNYDALHRCMERTYLDGNTIVRQDKILYLNHSEIGLAQDSNLHTLRVLGKGLKGEIGGAVAIEIYDAVYAPQHDHIGNVIALIDSQGHTAASYRYSAFGELETLSGDTLNNPWKFSSKYQDEHLVHYGLRAYCPAIGRFLTKDPAGYETGPNPYSFLLNNPLSQIDLFGLKEESPNLYDRTHDRTSWEYKENRERDTRNSQKPRREGPT
ncbi:MAG: RHS repeat-associated core domain-containing protein, partial [Parachlamydiaceae bacterium]